jgi:hypothetical protein
MELGTATRRPSQLRCWQGGSFRSVRGDDGNDRFFIKTGPSRFIADFQDDVAGWVLESGYRRLGRRQITIDTRGQLSYSPMTLKRGHAVQD